MLSLVIGLSIIGIEIGAYCLQFMVNIKTDTMALYIQHNQDVATIKRMRDALNQWDSCQLCEDHCPATMRMVQLQAQMSPK